MKLCTLFYPRCPADGPLQPRAQFTWGPAKQQSFDALKPAMTSAPVLRVWDPGLPTRLLTDASEPGLLKSRLAIRDLVKMSASAIRRLGDSAIPRIRGCQPDRAWPGQAQRRSYATQATKVTVRIFMIPSQHFELICNDSASRTVAAILLFE